MFQVEATDADSKTYGEVKYSIETVSNDGSSKFEVNADTGMIYVTAKVDRGEQYFITVKAHDQAPEKNRRYATIILQLSGTLFNISMII